MKIELDQETLKSVVSEAIFTSLTEQQRAAMIQAALSYLMTPAEDHRGYGAKTSPIQSAFNSALTGVANRIASEMLTADTTVQTHIKGLIEESVARMVSENRENTVNKIADAIAEGLTKKSSY